MRTCSHPAQVKGRFLTSLCLADTGFCNLCDYSTATLPVTRVDPSIDKIQPAHEFRSEADKTVYDFYNPETYKNAPIGIQVIGRKNEEEAVIR